MDENTDMRQRAFDALERSWREAMATGDATPAWIARHRQIMEDLRAGRLDPREVLDELN